MVLPTPASNISYGIDASPEAIVAAATTAGADPFVSALPEGYETALGPKGAGLSGGQRQRIAIARTLLRNPPILVLDEPTTGLDAESEAQVMQALAVLMQGRTTILITHMLGLALSADRIVVLDQGRIVQAGTPSDLLAVDGPFRSLAADQGLVASQGYRSGKQRYRPGKPATEVAPGGRTAERPPTRTHRPRRRTLSRRLIRREFIRRLPD